MKFCLPAFALTFALSGVVAMAQPLVDLDENCVVSLLNRSARVNPDGTWRIENVPANFSKVRVRATCVRDGVTLSGQSDYILLEPGIVNGFGPFQLGPSDPIPTAITVSVDSNPLTMEGQTAQLTVMASYPGRTEDVTAGQGINFMTSNPRVVSVDDGGRLTAVMSGTALISAMIDGALGMIQVQVVFAGDTDRDGIPDDVELANGLNPENPVDGMEDPDEDGLTNKEELVDYGTSHRVADTDGDSILDGEEVVAGRDGVVTNPLLGDSDGDGVWDALEIASGSDPNDPNDVNLAEALNSIEVNPSQFVLVLNTIVGEASRQLSVVGNLKDGRTLDLTSTARGTRYESSDLFVVNFGAPDGRVFAGQNGSARVTVANSGFEAVSDITVTQFDPTPLSFIAIPGYANNVVVKDGYAYVAAGSAGLQVVDVTNPASPQLVGAWDSPGNGNDVQVEDGLVFLADGSAGLRILDISDPTQPQPIGHFDTAGVAQDLRVDRTTVYVADGSNGLVIVDVSNPSEPQLAGGLDTAGNSRGVDFSGDLVVLAEESPSAGVRIIDVSNPALPVLKGQVLMGGGPKDVVVEGSLAYVIAFTSGFQVVDFSDPEQPRVRGAIPGSGVGAFVGRSVELEGGFALAAEQLFANLIAPIVDISDPDNPIFRSQVTWPAGIYGDYAGTGIDLEGGFVYVTAESFVVNPEFGASGNTRLFIGQYLSIEDLEGIPPTVSIQEPDPGSQFFEGQAVLVRADAQDDIAVASVRFLVNGEVVQTDTSAPYEFQYKIPKGINQVEFGAVALDLGNNLGQATPVVASVVPDTVPPTLAILSPVSGQSVTAGTSFLFEVDAADNVGIEWVDFLVNGVVTQRLTQGPFFIFESVPLSGDEMTLGARVQDVGGLEAVADEVTVMISPDQAPRVEILSPEPGQTALEGSVLTIEAEVFDDLGIQQVEILVNGEVVHTEFGGGVEFDVAQLFGEEEFGDLVVTVFDYFIPDGVPLLEIQVRAEDSNGQVTLTDPLVLTVTAVNDPPVLIIPFSAGAGGLGTVAGYYDMVSGVGVSTQQGPISEVGLTPRQIVDLSDAELSEISVLVVQNPSNNSYGQEYLSRLAAIEAAVENGMVLLIHDRLVAGAQTILPGSTGFQVIRNFIFGSNIDVLDPDSLVANGPGGVVNNSTLDGGNSSNHGYALSTSLPDSAHGLLSNSQAEQWVTFDYPFGRGVVIYSTIPLDFYLSGSSFFRTIYAPNVMAYAASRSVSTLMTAVNSPLLIEGIQVTDSDVNEDGEGELNLSLLISHGTLNLVSSAGLSLLEGNGTASIQFQGNLVAVNDALVAMTYTPETDFTGTDTLSIEVNDLGFTGVPGPQSDSAEVVILIGEEPPVAPFAEPRIQLSLSLDLDGDGAVNWNEFTAGTDPSDPESKLEILSTMVEGNDVWIEFSSELGKRYRLQVNDSALLMPSGWTTVASGLMGTGDKVRYRHKDGNIGQSMCLYRILVLNSTLDE